MPAKLSLADCLGILSMITAKEGLTTREISHKCVPFLSKQVVRNRLLYLRDHDHVRQETRMENGKRTSRWYLPESSP